MTTVAAQATFIEFLAPCVGISTTWSTRPKSAWSTPVTSLPKTSATPGDSKGGKGADVSVPSRMYSSVSSAQWTRVENLVEKEAADDAYEEDEKVVDDEKSSEDVL